MMLRRVRGRPHRLERWPLDDVEQFGVRPSLEKKSKARIPQIVPA